LLSSFQSDDVNNGSAQDRASAFLKNSPRQTSIQAVSSRAMKKICIFPLLLLSICLPHLSFAFDIDRQGQQGQGSFILKLSSSPLMMFGGDAKKSSTASESHLHNEKDVRDRDRRDEGSGAGVVERDQLAGGIPGQGVIESTTAPSEGERDDGSLTFEHFRKALFNDPEATRFVINEDEESGLSLQSSPAGSSRFALNENRVQNTTVIEAPRELLLIKHGGASELVNSFFGTSDPAAPLSAERLAEILERSDAAQKSTFSKPSQEFLIEQAKQASYQGQGGDNSYLWDRIVTKLKQANESWHYAQEKTAQGDPARATLWQQAAQESEAVAEGMKHVVLTYMAGDKTAAEALEKENWGAYYLSDAVTWDLKSAEALEKAKQAASTTPKTSRRVAFGNNELRSIRGLLIIKEKL